MNFFLALGIGLKEIWAHKFRSLLTMLGIVLGVASLVTMTAIVKGMENGLKESLIAMGGLNKVRIDDEDVPVSQEHLRDQSPGKTIRDVYALQENASLLELVSPEMSLRRTAITRGTKSTYPSEFVGVWPAVLDMNLYEVGHGRFFSPVDEENARSVCVIGTGIRDELFGAPAEDGKEIIPIGQTININDQPFVIVGMFKHYESEQTRRMRELAKQQPANETNQVQRRTGWRSPRWDAFCAKTTSFTSPSTPCG
jgi:putative ABC transport system permease protein